MTPTPPPDDLDRLLSAYFRRDVPTPFPPFRAPAPSADAAGLYANAAPSAFAGRSRATLAASVAALLGLGLLATSGPRPLPAVAKPAKPAGGPGLLQNSTADGSKLVPPTTKP